LKPPLTLRPFVVERPVWALFVFWLLCVEPRILTAQESIRPSETGDLASAARRQGETSDGNYFLKAGPVNFEASASLEADYNDNVGLAEKGRESDIILRPTIDLNAAWRATELNTLRFNVGFSYAAYLQHSNLNTHSVLLDPGSQLAFDVYVGDVLRLTFYDQFAILQNPIDEPTLSNVARFDRFQNSAGVTALFDFNDLKFVVGYDHFNYKTFGTEDFNFLDRHEEQIYASASLRLSDAVTAGVDANAALFYYDVPFNNDGDTFSAGPFVEATLSHYTTLRADGGVQIMNFQQTGTNGDTSNYHGWYAALTVAQRLNQYWRHSLSVGHESRLGLEVNYYEYYYARYLASWQLNPRLSLGIQAFVEDSDESGGAAQDAEHSWRWGGTLTLTYRLGRKLSAELSYGYVKKDSDLALRSYYQNLGTLGLKYEF
jgi:hypothetical protein